MKRFVIALALLVLVAVPASAQHDEATAEKPAGEGKATMSDETVVQGYRAEVASFVACAIAFITGVSVLGAAYAVAHVGSAAIGAASEKPEMMGRGLIFVALGEGLAVLGLAVAFLMMFMILKPLV